MPSDPVVFLVSITPLSKTLEVEVSQVSQLVTPAFQKDPSNGEAGGSPSV